VTSVLSAYFKALQDTANEQNYSVQSGIENVSGSVQNIPGVNQDKVQAVTGLAGVLTRLALNGYREGTLRLLINDGVAPAKRVVGLLKDTVPGTLSSNLKSEQIDLRTAFTSYVYQTGLPAPDPATHCKGGPRTADFPTVGANYLLAIEFCRRWNDANAKHAAIEKYSKSLDVADKALDELASSKTRLGAKGLAKELYRIGKELDDSIDAVEEAFGKGDQA
jgi:hypothetical protein